MTEEDDARALADEIVGAVDLPALVNEARRRGGRIATAEDLRRLASTPAHEWRSS